MPQEGSNFEKSVIDRLGRDLVIRAARPEDRPQIRSLIGQLSPRSRYFRFFQARESFAERELDILLGLTGESAGSVVAQAGGSIAGFAQYVRTGTASGDVAFAVADAEQGRGIGTLLFESLVEIARQNGIDNFSADVLMGNSRMMEVFENAGCRAKSDWEEESMHFDLDIRSSAAFEVARKLRSFVSWTAAHRSGPE